MIRTIFFDWGGVLCEDPTLGFIHHIVGYTGLSASKVVPVLQRYLPLFMKGLTEQEFWDRVSLDLQIKTISAGLWGKALADVYVPLVHNLQFARELSQEGWVTGVLSNTEQPSQAFHLDQGYDWFDVRIFSCAHGVLKPQAEIFRLAAQIARTPIENCLLLDDRPENVHGALTTGMQAMLVEGEDWHKQVRENFLHT